MCVRMPSDSPLVTVFQTPDLGLFAVVRSLLDSTDLPYEVQGEEGLHMLPVPGDTLLSRRSLGATIRVHPENADEVRELLSTFIDQEA